MEVTDIDEMETWITMLLAGLGVVTLVSCVVCAWRCTRSKKSPEEVRVHKEREKEDKPKLEMAMSSSQKLLRELDIGMSEDKVLQGIGMRRRKVFFRLLSSENYGQYVMSMAEVPSSHGYNNTSCRDHIINHFPLCQRLNHRYLQPLLALCLCSKEGEVLAGGVVPSDMQGHPPLLDKGRELPPVKELQVAIIERFHEKGSLKDLMHRVSPTRTRTEKYSSSASALPLNKVVAFGRQILEAILFLNGQLLKSMLPLSHIRMENIYVEKNVCKLGGYENDILGYTSYLQQLIEQAGHASSVDIIMFGHVMYYMCTGGNIMVEDELVALPGEGHFEAVDEKFRSILLYIFKMKKNKIKHSMREIYDHMFFATGSSEDQVPSSDSDGEGSGLKANLSKAKNWFRSRAASSSKSKPSDAAKSAATSQTVPDKSKSKAD